LHGTAVTADPAKVKQLLPSWRLGLQVAFSDSLHVVFLAAVPFAILAFLLALRLREVPLRATMGPPDSPAADPAERELTVEPAVS
jgi:hypothetical protein